jgi:hypothetical protein
MVDSSLATVPLTQPLVMLDQQPWLPVDQHPRDNAGKECGDPCASWLQTETAEHLKETQSEH